MRHLSNSIGPLELSTGRLTRDELLNLVCRLAADETLWRPMIRHDPNRRWYRRLYYARNVEIWLLGWDTGQDTRMHDHGGSSGAFYVTEGVLSEDYGFVESWTGARHRRHDAGRMRSFGPDYVHNLGNADTAPATSVHAYSPPLSAMTYYRPEDTALVPYETVVTAGPDEGVDVALAATAGDWVAGSGS